METPVPASTARPTAQTEPSQSSSTGASTKKGKKFQKYIHPMKRRNQPHSASKTKVPSSGQQPLLPTPPEPAPSVQQPSLTSNPVASLAPVSESLISGTRQSPNFFSNFPPLPATTPTPVSMGLSPPEPDMSTIYFPGLSSSEDKSSDKEPDTNPSQLKPEGVTSSTANASDPPEHVIHPCYDYTKYIFWIIQYFPKVMTTQGRYFVQMFLKISSAEDIIKYLSYFPTEWLTLLGKEQYIKYIPTIANLVIIWTIMLDRENPVHYNEYYDAQDKTYEIVSDELKSVIPLDDTPKRLAPPKYSRYSPTVTKHSHSSKHSEDSAPKSKSSSKSRSKSSNRSYHTTKPTMIDSHGIAMGDPDSDPDNSSIIIIIKIKH